MSSIPHSRIFSVQLSEEVENMGGMRKLPAFPKGDKFVIFTFKVLAKEGGGGKERGRREGHTSFIFLLS